MLAETFLQDVRYAIRTLRKNPGFATVATVTLALGIGANTAMYSLIHAVMFRPLPLSQPEHLVRIYETNPSRSLWTFPASVPNYLSWKNQARSLELANFIPVALNWSGHGQPLRLQGIAATASFLRVLGTTVHMGRWFIEEEERPGQHRVGGKQFGPCSDQNMGAGTAGRPGAGARHDWDLRCARVSGYSSPA